MSRHAAPVQREPTFTPWAKVVVIVWLSFLASIIIIVVIAAAFMP